MAMTRANQKRAQQTREGERTRTRTDRKDNPFMRAENSIFPETPTDDEWAYLWVRTHTSGVADTANVRAQLSGRLAYTPVRASDLPSVASLVAMSAMGSAESDEHIVVGDCMLCRIPKEMQEMYIDSRLYLSDDALAGIRARVQSSGAQIEADTFEK